MEYKVKLTFHATTQIQEAISYISKTLMEPEIAKRWADCLQEKISSLGTMPTKYPFTSEEPWHTRGIRKMPVKNFIVYYLIREDEKAVWITAVIYGRRNQISALRNMPL